MHGEVKQSCHDSDECTDISAMLLSSCWSMTKYQEGCWYLMMLGMLWHWMHTLTLPLLLQARSVSMLWPAISALLLGQGLILPLPLLFGRATALRPFESLPIFSQAAWLTLLPTFSEIGSHPVQATKLAGPCCQPRIARLRSRTADLIITNCYKAGHSWDHCPLLAVGTAKEVQVRTS